MKECVILSPGLAILFFCHHQEPWEGLYLHEAQELAEEMMRTTTWVGTTRIPAGFPNHDSGSPTNYLYVPWDE